MKRIITSLTIAVLMCMSTSVLAAEYDKDNNSVSVDGSGYQTVIITKDGDTSDDGIVYVNQTDSGAFGASMNFLLKDNPAPGYYTITLGGAENAENSEASFYIGAVKPDDESIGSTTDFQYRFVEESETPGCKDIVLTWEEMEGSNAKSLIVDMGDKGFGWDLNGNIDGKVMIAVKIQGIPKDVNISNAYISSKTIHELTSK